jgi:hypothetical protein
MVVGISWNKLDESGIARKIVTLSAGGATIWLFIQIILLIGVEKKSLFQLFADILGGGTAGALMRLLFFVVFEAIGWVSGALYGALGLLSLMFGGALAGLGMVSLIHIARNPCHYNFIFPVILVSIVITWLFVKWVMPRVGRLYDLHGPSLVQWFMGKASE